MQQIGIFLMFLAVITALLFGFFIYRNKSRSRRPSKGKKGRKRPDRKERDESPGPTPEATDDKKTKKQKEKVMDALLRLEEELASGDIDQETYDASKAHYLDYLKHLKKR